MVADPAVQGRVPGDRPTARAARSACGWTRPTGRAAGWSSTWPDRSPTTLPSGSGLRDVGARVTLGQRSRSGRFVAATDSGDTSGGPPRTAAEETCDVQTRARGPGAPSRRRGPLHAYLHRFFTCWVAEDPDPAYSALDRSDGLGQVPGSCLPARGRRCPSRVRWSTTSAAPTGCGAPSPVAAAADHGWGDEPACKPDSVPGPEPGRRSSICDDPLPGRLVRSTRSSGEQPSNAPASARRHPS